jgi:hypothetical protein
MDDTGGIMRKKLFSGEMKEEAVFWELGVLQGDFTIQSFLDRP